MNMFQCFLDMLCIYNMFQTFYTILYHIISYCIILIMFLSTNGNFDLVARLCFRSDDPCILFLPKKNDPRAN